MLGYGISKFDLKVINRAQIMRTIWACGPISRSDIAEKLCITRAAITVITNEMIGEGLIKEIGRNDAEHTCDIGKGRRKVLLDIETDVYFQMGIYIDSHNISIGLTTLKGDILEKENIPIDPDISFESIITIIGESLKRILINSCLSEKQVTGIGIGVMPDMPNCILAGIQKNKMYYSDLQKVFTKKIGIPVFIDNAISQFAIVCWSERRRTGRHCRSCFIYSDDEKFYLTHILNFPSLFEEFKTTAGINSLCVKLNGRNYECNCDGSVRTELTPKAIGRKVAGIYGESATPALYKMTEGDGRIITISQIMTAVSLGDEKLRGFMDELLDEMSLMINNIISISGAENVYFYKFGFSDEQLQELLARCEKNFGCHSDAKLSVCDIDDEHRFVCGCAYAVFRGIFSVSGKASVSE